jgi:hypothetical protein
VPYWVIRGHELLAGSLEPPFPHAQQVSSSLVFSVGNISFPRVFDDFLPLLSFVLRYSKHTCYAFSIGLTRDQRV